MTFLFDNGFEWKSEITMIQLLATEKPEEASPIKKRPAGKSGEVKLLHSRAYNRGKREYCERQAAEGLEVDEEAMKESGRTAAREAVEAWRQEGAG